MTKREIIQDPDNFRTKVRNVLSTYFTNTNDGINLEIGIYNWVIKEANRKKVVKKWDNPFFTQLYKDKFRSVYYALSKTNVVSMVNNKEIKSQEIASMTAYELCPEKWHDMLQAKIIRDKNKDETHVEAMTDTYVCRKCRSRRCSYYTMQTRSADEPETIYITCLDCGTRMKK
jgi:DNA-directed RNA polymerase subunit M/transcription elongation factor TFIIS